MIFMVKKQGITLTMLAITIVIMLIIAGTITVSTYSSVNYSRLSTWANEIRYIQDVVNEQLNSSTVFYDNLQIIEIDVSNLNKQQMEAQFSGETITENNIIELKVLDLGALKIANTIYGNLSNSTDVYAFSETTGKVYYVHGIEIDNTTYYTLTEALNKRFDITNTTQNLSTVVFVPSQLGYTNEPVSVKVKIPTKFSNIVISTSNDAINIGSQTTVDNIYEYDINTNNIIGNYVLTVSYNDGVQTVTTKYEVNSYDIEKPIIQPFTSENFVYKETDDKIVDSLININAQDVSGIKQIKYELGKIEQVDAKDYFKDNGKLILNKSIKFDNTVDIYTIYVEDNAGNYLVQEYDFSHKAYAIYSETDKSLTFVKTRSTLNESEVYKGKSITKLYNGIETSYYDYDIEVPWYSQRGNITNVVVEDKISPISTKNWFNSFNNCSKFDVARLDTSKVNDMKCMFYYVGNSQTVTSFEIIGMDDWDTSNVTKMTMMFVEAGQYATDWDIGNLSKWNTSKVEDMYQMFTNAGKEAKICNVGDLGTKEIKKEDGVKYIAWDVSRVTRMSEMFGGMGEESNEIYIGTLDNWNVSSVETMDYMFAYNGTVDTTWSIGDLSNWDVSKVKSMISMFHDAGFASSNWSIGNLEDWDTSNVESFKEMFHQSGKKSTNWSVGDLSKWNTKKATNMKGMFSQIGENITGDTVFSLGDLSKWNTSSVTDMSSMFASTAPNAKWSLDLSGWDVKNITSYTDFNKHTTSQVIPPNFN